MNADDTRPTERGHNPLPWPEDDERPGPECYCGRRGCIETFLSGPAMVRDHEAVTGEELTTHEISRDLRRDRDLAFYGAEDLTPSGFYSLDDAEKARSGARLTVKLVEPHVGSG